MLAEALAVLDEDERVNRDGVGRAADLIRELCDRRPLRLLTHCNAGRLATVAWGTALGVVWHLAAAGDVEYVLADETRPLLQGARLTAYELAEAGHPLPDLSGLGGRAGDVARHGRLRHRRRRPDRRHGDVANKIGTYGLALAAARHGIPFIVVAPSPPSTPRSRPAPTSTSSSATRPRSPTSPASRSLRPARTRSTRRSTSRRPTW